ncbi:MAG: DUF3592 domain-containing protein [Chloroflexi bacterium]|nr:DUF3592 domain-containing protein [Chloroflexota bacterium]
MAILISIFVPLAARLLYLAASRQREYLADATAALLTRYPAGLASALEKIAQAPARLQVNGATAPLCIVNPLQSGTGVGWLAALFSTHPPTERRIAILRGMGGGAGYADYERAYNATVRGGSVLPASVRAAAGPAARAATVGAAAFVAPAEAGTDAAALVAGVEAAASAPAQPDVASYRAARATIRGAAGYRDVTCSCGLLIRIPPGFGRPTVRCPQCGASVAVDGGSIAGAAVTTGLSGDEGTRAQRRSEGATGCIAQGCAFLIGPAFLLAGLGVWALAAWQLSVLEASKTWPTTPGVVVESGVESRRDRESGDLTYMPVVVYRYEVRGTSYRSRRLYPDVERSGSSDRVGAQRTAERYPANAVVTVTYDPTDPGFAFLSRDSGGPVPTYVWLFAFGVPFFAVGLFVFILMLRRRSPASAPNRSP